MKYKKSKNNYFVLLLFILVTQSAGIIGTFFTISSIPTWYASLNKPFFSPPNYIFGPVWIILYTLIGTSGYLIWKSKINKKQRKKALNIFYVQLVLNSLWTIIFFGLKLPTLALIEIFALLGTIFYMTKIFKNISLTASYLLIPYLLWVSFASLLNAAIILLN